MAHNGVKQQWPEILNAIARQINHAQTLSVQIRSNALISGMNMSARKYRI